MAARPASKVVFEKSEFARPASRRATERVFNRQRHAFVQGEVVMILRGFRMGMIVLGLGWAGTALAGDSVEDVAKKIAEATKKLKSFSATTKTVTEMKQEGFSMKSSMDGTTEMLRKGDNLMMRMEGKGMTETETAGYAGKQQSTSLMINDGEFTYALSEMDGTKSAYKTKAEKTDDDPFKVWKESADLKLLPDSSIDGNAVWVIEATPKGNQDVQGKTVLYFHKDSGQMVKMVVSTPDGTPMTTMTCGDIKVNPSISADRFVFKAPPGVEIQDMSK